MFVPLELATPWFRIVGRFGKLRSMVFAMNLDKYYI